MISKDGRMKIRISESRFKQIVREELAIAKLQRRLREDAPTQPAGTQLAAKPAGNQAASDTARRKKQYTCRCGAKFMDYEGIKGTPLCPKCNDAEVSATGQAKHEAASAARKMKQYTCKCGKKFRDYANLDLSDGPPVCPKCDSMLIMKQNRKRGHAAE